MYVSVNKMYKCMYKYVYINYILNNCLYYFYLDSLGKWIIFLTYDLQGRLSIESTKMQI